MDFKNLYFSILQERIKTQSALIKDKERRKFKRRIRKDDEWKRLSYVAETNETKYCSTPILSDDILAHRTPAGFVSEDIFGQTSQTNDDGEDISQTYEKIVKGNIPRNPAPNKTTISLACMQSLTDFLLVELELKKLREEEMKWNWYEIEIESDLQRAIDLKHRLSIEIAKEKNSTLTIL